MLLKKMTLIGSALLAFGYSFLAYANLNVYNKTNEYFTFKILSTGKCFFKMSAQNHLSITPVEFQNACEQKTDKCIAELHSMPDCTGDPVVYLRVDVTNAHAELVSDIADPYWVDIPLPSIVILRYS